MVCQREHWAPKGGGLWDPTLVGEANEALLIRVWKPLPSIRVLKTLRGGPKGKTQRGQYLLAVGLDSYNRNAFTVSSTKSHFPPYCVLSSLLWEHNGWDLEKDKGSHTMVGISKRIKVRKDKVYKWTITMGNQDPQDLQNNHGEPRSTRSTE